VLTSIHPFTYHGLTGPLSRGKLPLSTLEDAKAKVRALVGRFSEQAQPAPAPADPPYRAGDSGEYVDLSDCVALRVRGGRAGHLLHEASTAHILSLEVGKARRTLFLKEDGTLLSEAIVGRLPDDPLGRERYLVLAPPKAGKDLGGWLSALSDGYVLFGPKDIWRKVQGPAVVEDLADHGQFVLLGGDGELELEEKIRIAVVSCEEAKGLKVRRRHAPEPFLGLDGDATTLFSKHPELFAARKPYFVGQHRIFLPEEKEPYRPQVREADGKKTPLTELHRKLGARMAPFAGYEMPLWYTSALEEHRAVRKRAGLFDLGHMGVIEVSGRYAESFLNLVTTNYAGWLRPGQSQYGFLLDPEGRVIDDLMVYRRGKEKFLLVVNAVNEEVDWDWLVRVNSGEVLLDPDRPWIEPDGEVELRGLKAPGAEDGRVDLALQGPASRKVLARLLSPRDRRRLAALRRTEFVELSLQGKEVLCARTGYTGEAIGYELYVHPEDAPGLWEAILDAGGAFGVLPCGLAARDSLRTEAGLPLYGHELAGEHEILPHEAGFAPYVKLHKPFFIGRAAYLAALRNWSREIVRFQVGPGTRPIRAGAGVVDRSGELLGWVTSCAVVEGGQVGMALVWKRGLPVGTPLGFLFGPGAPPEKLELGARLPLVVWGEVVPRFPERRLLPRVGEE